jgi:hypothetical protein
LNSSSGDSKLIRGAEALPSFQASAKSPSVSANGRISIVTVFITPPLHILEKIRHQLIGGDEAIFHFLVAHVLMVTLARLVVITQYTFARDYEYQPVFVAMIAAASAPPTTPVPQKRVP